ncbi:MAG: 7-carboxy-7-deazaguanine synthase QueE [Candidatus Eremiobacteraeota bacterium]|nr:7-carboxy-7-deazaguanine synthase QueE [Candidatus Eremiobacteraeota bacterium]
MIKDTNKSTTNQAFLCEIFSSISGEGLFCGLRQLFVRLAGCNISCSFCDASETQSIPERFRVETKPGTPEYETFPNPVSIDRFLQLIKDFNKFPHHSISFTGGEPLLQVGFLASIFPILKESGHTIYLETNGTLPGNLKKVLPYIDIIAMDIKLPSISGIENQLENHREFISTAWNEKYRHSSGLVSEDRFFIKIVIGDNLDTAELDRACEMIAGFSPDIPLILQPMTDPDGRIHPEGATCISLQDRALGFLRDVRVIPQLHKILGGIL